MKNKGMVIIDNNSKLENNERNKQLDHRRNYSMYGEMNKLAFNNANQPIHNQASKGWKIYSRENTNYFW